MCSLLKSIAAKSKAQGQSRCIEQHGRILSHLTFSAQAVGSRKTGALIWGLSKKGVLLGFSQVSRCSQICVRYSMLL